MKKILITGANSYIGTSVEKWLMKEPANHQVDTLDMQDENWRDYDFSPYDVVFHVAGIAHVSADPKLKDLYYRVNSELTIETAKKTKNEKVKQFIFMSSIIVYGDSSSKDRVITKDTIPTPSNFYGDSKLQAEKGIELLRDENFKVVILRPPMIYGPGSKGNYPRLSKLAQKTPIFPDFPNQRSMLFIDNLCEFVKQMIINEETGIFFPQNKEYVSTTELVRQIAKVHNHKIIFTKMFNPLIRLMFKSQTIKKMFGNLTYERQIITKNTLDTIFIDFNKSILLTESKIKE
ncbi:MAG: NAD-dependent epimerase/dehydratase family protein [Sphaerochaetaceae bacterium]|nr:NAD-dependent epimerase/dehydratase family protein [Sphaerochaetaceae bacterium]